MMKNKHNVMNIVGWALFIIAIGIFSFQMGYLFISRKYQVEYIDDRLFYIINICSVFFLTLAILLLIRLKKKTKLVVVGAALIFVIVHIFLLVSSNQAVKNMTSISPDWKHVLSIKANVENGTAIYYRNYYGILARPKERLASETKGKFQVEWLANDVAAVTYEARDNTIQQFIGTYGDRGSGGSYYQLGAAIDGRWQGDNIQLISDPEGITVMEGDNSELFEWENIQQYGTLAVVLKRDKEAAWTISLNENFEFNFNVPDSTGGNISIYEATMEKNEPITLEYKGSN